MEKPTVKVDRQGAPAPIIDPEQLVEAFPQLEIGEVLGQGGMGVVYRARQKHLDRMVALKILPPTPDRDESFAERFGREARALARLQHPNIVTVYDSGHAGDLYYFIMEYIDGTNLRQVMASGAEPAQALQVVTQVCDALQYAHDEGIVHRDIKPENILIDRRGRVKIADFGIAKLVVRGGTDYTLTSPQQVIGTMHYMAPEQVERPTEVDHRADLYALGVVFYELLTGELPIGRFPLPSQKATLDGRLDEVVLHALEKEPDQRYQQASDIKSAVATVVGSPESTPVSFAAPPGGGNSATSHPPAYTFVPSQAGTLATGLAYALWALGFFGLCGIHRFYAGKWITGIIWLCTGGLFFIGQLIDAFLIPGMVRLANAESMMQSGAQVRRA